MIWRDIPGYEGHYQISDKGLVKSLKWGKERILKPRYMRGYQNVWLSKDGNTKSIQVHQLVTMAFLGHTPNGMSVTVDHINGVKDDNRPENLRLVSHRENIHAYYRQAPSTSRYVGVSWDKKTGKWTAQIYVNKKDIYLGRFVCEDKAAKAYQDAAKTYRDGPSK